MACRACPIFGIGPANDGLALVRKPLEVESACSGSFYSLGMVIIRGMDTMDTLEAGRSLQAAFAAVPAILTLAVCAIHQRGRCQDRATVAALGFTRPKRRRYRVCTGCSGGWTRLLSRKPRPSGAGGIWRRMPGAGGHCGGRQSPAGDSRGGTARGAPGGGLYSRFRPDGGAKGGSGPDEGNGGGPATDGGTAAGGG